VTLYIDEHILPEGYLRLATLCHQQLRVLYCLSATQHGRKCPIIAAGAKKPAPPILFLVRFWCRRCSSGEADTTTALRYIKVLLEVEPLEIGNVDEGEAGVR
jgi:hypothetical protein